MVFTVEDIEIAGEPLDHDVIFIRLSQQDSDCDIERTLLTAGCINEAFEAFYERYKDNREAQSASYIGGPKSYQNSSGDEIRINRDQEDVYVRNLVRGIARLHALNSDHDVSEDDRKRYDALVAGLSQEVLSILSCVEVEDIDSNALATAILSKHNQIPRDDSAVERYSQQVGGGQRGRHR